ncbi:hypothetical protein TrLO_g9623 [Triparma laevis f. longispina]|uniref:Uncharacterized protein n=1 Tax=Triparma laevis f. longispina TaxID=1714387 RepID=A0A9W7FS89_9STRA|nr:hypothetical protein TrLO_g9623 [Triparma laevis f. longispina]
MRLFSYVVLAILPLKSYSFTRRFSTRAIRTDRVRLRSIPPEAFEVVAEAEANSPAGKSRNLRVAGYGAGAAIASCVGLIQAAGVGGAEVPDWVDYLPASGYLGCFFDTVGVAFFGTFITLEFQTRDKNRLDIYEELLRRREGGGGSGEGGGVTAKKEKKKKKNKKQRGIDEIASLEMKRVGEREGVLVQKEEEVKVGAEDAPNSKKSMFDKAKDFYKEADSLAYQNALLLNKKLEDEGVLEKITDETGLKVVRNEEGDGDGNGKEE